MSLLHPYKPPTPGSGHHDVPQPLDWFDGNPKFAVGGLVGHRKTLSHNMSSHDYKVHWAGFPSSQDSFEPRAELMKSIPDDVLDYEAANHLAAPYKVHLLKPVPGVPLDVSPGVPPAPSRQSKRLQGKKLLAA